MFQRFYNPFKHVQFRNDRQTCASSSDPFVYGGQLGQWWLGVGCELGLVTCIISLYVNLALGEDITCKITHLLGIVDLGE